MNISWWWMRIRGRASYVKDHDGKHYKALIDGAWVYHRTDGFAWLSEHHSSKYFLFGQEIDPECWGECSWHVKHGSWGANEIRMFNASWAEENGFFVRSVLRDLFAPTSTAIISLNVWDEIEEILTPKEQRKVNEQILLPQREDYEVRELAVLPNPDQHINIDGYLSHQIKHEGEIYLHKVDGYAATYPYAESRRCVAGYEITDEAEWKNVRALAGAGWGINDLRTHLSIATAPPITYGGIADPWYRGLHNLTANDQGIYTFKHLSASTGDPNGEEVFIAEGAEHHKLVNEEFCSIYHNTKGPAYVNLQNPALNRYYLYGFSFQNKKCYLDAANRVDRGEWGRGAVELYKRWLARKPHPGRILGEVLSDCTTRDSFDLLLDNARGKVQHNDPGSDQFFSFMATCRDTHRKRYALSARMVQSVTEAGETRYEIIDDKGEAILHRLDGPAIWHALPSKQVWAIGGRVFEKNSPEFNKLVSLILGNDWDVEDIKLHLKDIDDTELARDSAKAARVAEVEREKNIIALEEKRQRKIEAEKVDPNHGRLHSIDGPVQSAYYLYGREVRYAVWEALRLEGSEIQVNLVADVDERWGKSVSQKLIENIGYDWRNWLSRDHLVENKLQDFRRIIANDSLDEDNHPAEFLVVKALAQIRTRETTYYDGGELVEAEMHDDRGRIHSVTGPAAVSFHRDFHGGPQYLYYLHGMRFEERLWSKIANRIQEDSWTEGHVDILSRAYDRGTNLGDHIFNLITSMNLGNLAKKQVVLELLHDQNIRQQRSGNGYSNEFDRNLAERSTSLLSELLTQLRHTDNLAQKAEKEMEDKAGGTGGMMARGVAMGAKLAVAEQLNAVCVDMIEKAFEAAGFGEQYPQFLKTEAGRIMMEGGGPIALYYFLDNFPHMFELLGIKPEQLETFKNGLEIAFTAAAMKGFTKAIGEARKFLMKRMDKVSELTGMLRDMEEAIDNKDYGKVLQISEHAMSAKDEVDALTGAAAKVKEAVEVPAST